MYKETLEHKLVQKIGQYGIVKTKEQFYLNDGRRFGREHVVYDVCLDGGDGDIVASFNMLKVARKWAKGELKGAIIYDDAKEDTTRNFGDNL